MCEKDKKRNKNQRDVDFQKPETLKLIRAK
jgi:hypothetical protein